jgi:hypothetical protein
MSGNDELGDIIAELTKLQEEHEALKAKVREVSCLKHILDKGDAGEETQEQFDDSWDELDLLVDIGEISINLFPVDELNEIKAKVREICKLAKCCDGCSNEEYLQLWKDLEELAR